jgi:hypothetical protein
MNYELNEWGTPDWCDEGSYGVTENWSWNKWRWEFLRRCEDYREAYSRAVERSKPEDLECDEGIYGFLFLLNPSRNDYPEEMLIGPYVPDLLFPYIEDDMRWSWDWQETDCLLRIDIYAPLDEQLSAARLKLHEWQKEFLGGVVKKKRHVSKWLSYLRTLDAKASGASWSEIASIHRDTAATPQTARDIWKAADRLRFKEFE